MDQTLEQILKTEYGIQAMSIREVPAGWSASAWRVHSDCGDFFLKVYDKQKPSTKGWIARIDSYMPVVLWLHGNTDLRNNMIAPLLAGDGSYKCEDDNNLYMVFPFIDGHTICSEKLNPGQVKEIAQIVAQLHSYGSGIPVPTCRLREDFDVSFCRSLTGWLSGGGQPESMESLAPYAEAITDACVLLQDQAAALRKSDIRYALCHTDIHGWNLMQSKNLILIDWEGLKLAPVEADLFSFTDTYFFDYAWEEFLAAYRSVHKDFQLDPDAIRFYRLRRRLEDIHAFADSILHDDLSPAEEARSLQYLKRECALLGRT